MTAIAERRDDLVGARRQRERHRVGDRARERALAQRARPAADHAAARQHDVREPARHARRPRRAGRRVQARDEGPGAVPARAAPAAGRRAADDPRPAPRSCAVAARTTTSSRRRGSSRSCSRSATPGVPQRPPGAREGPAGARVRAALHARPRRLVPRLRPGRRPTTTPTATSPASSRSSTPSSSPTTRPAACSRRSRRRRASTACRPASIRRCPGAATQPPADGSAPFTDGGSLDCDPALVLPGP